MRLKLTLSCKKGAALALNNRYELSAILYKIIEKADSEFADWLHNKGYAADGRTFKLFTFGWLDAYPYLQGDGVQISKEGKVTWEISFCIDKIIENFVAGLFQDASFEFKAGFQEKVHFRIENVEILQPPVFAETMRYSTVTPILIGKKNENSKHETYLSPLDEGYAEIFIHNLRGKVMAVQGDAFEDADVSFRLLSPPDMVRKKAFTIYKKDIAPMKYIPYLFDFELIAPVEWQQILYFAGGGQDNALGIGMCKSIR